jgi:hypothetical protein
VLAVVDLMAVNVGATPVFVALQCSRNSLQERGFICR